MTDKNTTNLDFIEYSWDSKTRSTVLSSFFWGYGITQVPGGLLSLYFGGKITLLCSIFLCSILGILTPLSAQMGDWPLVCALRATQGLLQGVVFPSTHHMLSKWAPFQERGILSIFIYSGVQFGTVLMIGSSGMIASSLLGWPSIFYAAGGGGLLWCVACAVWGADTPSDYRAISVEEKELIESSVGYIASEPEGEKKVLKIPWKSIFTSPCFLVIVVAHSTHNWGFWTMMTQIPSYIHSVHGQDIGNNALLSALPYLAMLLMCIFFGFVSAYLNRHSCMSVVTSRKVFNTIGQWTPVITLICLGYTSEEDIYLAIAMLTVTVGMGAAIYLGFVVNHIDLAPNFAGTLMGITNCVANIMSIFAPLLVGFVVVDVKDAKQWRIVFFITAGFYFIGNLLFIIFAKGELQPWNSPQE